MAALPAAQGYWVAISGGLDSMVLAHLALRSLAGVRLLHINHGLSPHAQAWQQQVETWAKAQGIPCKSLAVSVDKNSASLEAAARAARYAAFEHTLAAGEALLCAHHRDDQAETLLLRLLRGSGLKGLGGMAPARRLGAGLLLRPLLAASRAELHAYAQAFQLPWVEDESNQDERFQRNWLRHQLMPQLSERWPTAAAQLAQTCLRLQEEQSLLETYLADDLAALSPRPERLGHSLLLKPSAPERRRSLLRYWFNQLGLLPPSQAVLHQMEQLIHSRIDSEACVTWGQWQLRRYNGRLYVLPQLPPMPAHWHAQWHTNSPLPLVMPNGLQVTAAPQPNGFPAATYTLRLRQGGERSHPAGRTHSQTLKKLMQEAELEPWLRGVIPLVYQGDCLVAVGDLWVEQGFVVAGGLVLRTCGYGLGLPETSSIRMF
ncbi:MAG: tRNA lysidine(34) synthetase TilS [Pseudomonadota bacterium]